MALQQHGTYLPQFGTTVEPAIACLLEIPRNATSSRAHTVLIIEFKTVTACRELRDSHILQPEVMQAFSFPFVTICYLVFSS